MIDNLDSGNFKIVSIAQGNSPIGVGIGRSASQIVHVNGRVHNWVLHKIGDHRYLLSVGAYHYTGVEEDKVIASSHPHHEEEWEITHHEHHNAYAIALANDPHLGWTVPVNVGGWVELKPIQATHSIPPHFLPTQLFSITKLE